MSDDSPPARRVSFLPSLWDLSAIAATALLFAASAWGISKFMDKAYQAVSTVMMAEQMSAGALSGLTTQLSGVSAALFGSNIAAGEKAKEALATLRSHRLALRFLSTDDRLSTFEAGVQSTDTAELSLDERLDGAASLLRLQVLSVSDDIRTGTIRVSITWFDPDLAAKWANEYVAVADQLMRERAIDDARRSIEFLTGAAQKAESIELRQAVFRIVESQINAEMLASTRPEYAFRLIDPATVPGAPVRPKSWLIAVAGALLGAAVAFAAVVLRDWARTGVVWGGVRAVGPTRFADARDVR